MGSMYVSLIWIIRSIIKFKIKVLSHTLYESSIIVVILKIIGCYIICLLYFKNVFLNFHDINPHFEM